jgi:ketosteroid isomerase-like protein
MRNPAMLRRGLVGVAAAAAVLAAYLVITPSSEVPPSSAATQLADQRAATAPDDVAVDVVHAFYRSLQAKDIEAFAALWTPDAVYRVPVTPEGAPGQTVGRDAIVSSLREFFALFCDTRFTWQPEPMSDPQRAMATWTLDIQLRTGGTYQNRGVAIFQLKDGKISDFTEYFDTAAFLNAFGRA